MLCAYRIFLPFAGITVSSREQAHFRDGIIRIAATKVSAGVSTGIGDHEEKYSKDKTDGKNQNCVCGNNVSKSDSGDEQFEISDDRSFEEIYQAIKAQGLQPVLNDYIMV